MKYIALMLLIISFVLLATGCSKSYGEWKEDAQKVIENNLNSTYQTYIVDPESYMEVEGEYGRRYSLSNEEVSPQSVGAQIGSVSVSGQASAVIVIDEVTNTPVPRDELSAIDPNQGC